MKKENMTFGEAVEAMKRGEKVTLASLDRDCHFYIQGGTIVHSDVYGLYNLLDMRWTFDIYAATDWKIYRDKPVLNPCCGEVKFQSEMRDGILYYYALCSQCGMRTPYCTSKEASAKIWNKAHPVAEKKTRTNFEKWATVENIKNIVGDLAFDCRQCPAYRVCCADHDRCSHRFLEWANAPAEEE